MVEHSTPTTAGRLPDEGPAARSPGGPEAEDVGDVPSGEREAAVEALMSRTHVAMSVRLSPDRPPSSFRARVRQHRLHDLTLVDTTCDPCSGVRSRRRAALTREPYLGVMVLGRGRETVDLGDGIRADMRPGSAVVWRSDRPARIEVHEPQTKRTLIVPRSALDEVGAASRLFRTTVLEPSAPGTRLLTGYLDLLARSGAQLGTQARGAARNAALELVAAAVAGGDPSSGTGVPTPPRALVDAWIEGQLLGGDLRPERIAAAQGLSVRTLYRMFEESGETVAAYVRARRLARARHDIVTTGETITDIAIRWGYTDASHFSRAFRGAYGSSPSDYRELFSGCGPMPSP
ncbi:helix-turn-helix domain-containing protein [Actinomycetospora flava]|uniref:Helix-turn-helix domain-containing protein n=1 Tax=Actinomycetospora flava TaxID=3129232 RepID=A0ABU8MAK3_9PSEU